MKGTTTSFVNQNSGGATAGQWVPKAVLFDMDGLMLDTERPIVDLWLEAAQELGWTLDRSVPISAIGINFDDTRKLVLDRCGQDFPFEAVVNRVGELYRAKQGNTGPDHRPGLLTLLDALEARGIPLAVATSTGRSMAIDKLGAAGILDRFTALACGDEVTNGKPAPDIFLLAAQRLGFNAADCVGFEDSPAGLKSLAAAGVRSVFIKDMLEPPADVLATVWRRFDHLAEAVVLFP